MEHKVQAEDNESKEAPKDGRVKGIPLLLAHEGMLSSYLNPDVPIVAATEMQKVSGWDPEQLAMHLAPNLCANPAYRSSLYSTA